MQTTYAVEFRKVSFFEAEGKARRRGIFYPVFGTEREKFMPNCLNAGQFRFQDRLVCIDYMTNPGRRWKFGRFKSAFRLELIILFVMHVSRCKQPAVAWLGLQWVLFSVVAYPVSAPAESGAVTAAASAAPVMSPLNPKYDVGAWIWAAETHDQQLCRLWRAFEIPPAAKVVSARLRITADNSYSLFLDGRELGRGGDWKDLTEYDLTLLLEPGLHTLAVEAFNTFQEAGVLAGLRVELADGRTIEIASDKSWKVVPNTESRWEKRTPELLT